MTCGEKIAALRKENNLSQEQFAEIMSVSRQAVSKWELNDSFPDTEKLIRISQRFSCSLDYLLKEEIEEKDPSSLPESDMTKRNYLIGMFLTYLSFPPLFGFILGVFSLVHQNRTIQNKSMRLLSILGIIFSLTVTAVMVTGFVCEL